MSKVYCQSFILGRLPGPDQTWGLFKITTIFLFMEHISKSRGIQSAVFKTGTQNVTANFKKIETNKNNKTNKQSKIRKGLFLRCLYILFYSILLFLCVCG